MNSKKQHKRSSFKSLDNNYDIRRSFERKQNVKHQIRMSTWMCVLFFSKESLSRANYLFGFITNSIDSPSLERVLV